MKTSNSVLGILGGIGIGVALGVLFAPDKGTETRKKISKKGSNLTDDIKLKFDDLIGLLENIVSKADTKGTEYINDAQSLIEQINQDVVIKTK